MIVIDKSGRTALNHLYLIDVTLRVRVPSTTGILQFGAYKCKISCVLNLRSTRNVIPLMGVLLGT